MVEIAHGNNKNNFPRRQTRGREHADDISNIAGRVEYRHQLGQTDESLKKMEEGLSHSVSSDSLREGGVDGSDELSISVSSTNDIESGRLSADSNLSESSSSQRSVEDLDV